MYLVFTCMPGVLWWSLCILYLLVCQVRVTVGDWSLLCSCDIFWALINSLVLQWFAFSVTDLCELPFLGQSEACWLNFAYLLSFCENISKRNNRWVAQRLSLPIIKGVVVGQSYCPVHKLGLNPLFPLTCYVPFKACSRSEYSHTCFTHSQESFPCL